MYVGVVDDGIDISHPDLAVNIFNNRWDPPNGIDDDGNGYVDDTHGWDFYNDDNSVYDGQDHFDFVDADGTVVAGEIAAVGNNRIGVAGVDWNVKIIPAKFLGPFDGSTADAISALDYLTDLKLRHGLNIVATNNSYEGDDTDSHALQAAYQTRCGCRHHLRDRGGKRLLRHRARLRHRPRAEPPRVAAVPPAFWCGLHDRDHRDRRPGSDACLRRTGVVARWISEPRVSTLIRPSRSGTIRLTTAHHKRHPSWPA